MKKVISDFNCVFSVGCTKGNMSRELFRFI